MTKAMRLLIDAQRESDAAKGIHRLGYAQSLRERSKKDHYARKLQDEINLIRLLSGTKNPEMSYYVALGTDQSGNRSFIVYFEFSINGKPHQVSFHNPYGRGSVLSRYVGHGRRTEWTGRIGDSYEAAEDAIRTKAQ